MIRVLGPRGEVEMDDMAYIVSRTLENKIAIAEHNNQNEMLVTLDVLKIILALLKEQEKEHEEVEPIIMNHTVFGTSRKCSKCNRALFPAGEYCPHCGRPVEW